MHLENTQIHLLTKQRERNKKLRLKGSAKKRIVEERENDKHNKVGNRKERIRVKGRDNQSENKKANNNMSLMEDDEENVWNSIFWGEAMTKEY